MVSIINIGQFFLIAFFLSGWQIFFFWCFPPVPTQTPQMLAVKLQALKKNYVVGKDVDILIADWTSYGVIVDDSLLKGAGKGLFAVRGQIPLNYLFFPYKSISDSKHCSI